MPIPDYTSTDTCSRCGLPRVTRELEEQGMALLCDDCRTGRCIHLCIEKEGTVVRLCDDCYWGREFANPTPPAPVRKPAADVPPRPS